jgi:hypothetical protein
LLSSSGSNSPKHLFTFATALTDFSKYLNLTLYGFLRARLDKLAENFGTISGFRCGINDIVALLGYYAAYTESYLPMIECLLGISPASEY